MGHLKTPVIPMIKKDTEKMGHLKTSVIPMIGDLGII